MLQYFLRNLLNYAISASLVVLFNQIGWLKITYTAAFTVSEEFNFFITAGIIAVGLLITGECLGILYRLTRPFFFMFGCILFPIYVVAAGYLKLIIVGSILANWFVFNPNPIFVVIMSLSIGLFRLPGTNEVNKDMKEFKKWQKQQRNKKD